MEGGREGVRGGWEGGSEGGRVRASGSGEREGGLRKGTTE